MENKIINVFLLKIRPGKSHSGKFTILPDGRRGGVLNLNRVGAKENLLIVVLTRSKEMAASDSEGESDTEVMRFKDFQTEIKNAVEEAKCSITAAIIKVVDDKLNKLTETVGLMADSVNSMLKATQANEEKIKVLQKDNKEMEKHNKYFGDKLMDLENRARRSNLRLKNVPEAEDMDNIIEWMAKQLPELGISRDCIDRIHRVGNQTKGAAWPRDVVMCFGRYKQKEQVAKAFKVLDRRDQLRYNGKKVMVFEDLCSETIRRKKELRIFTKMLQENDFKYNWRIAPFALRVQYKEETLFAKDQQQMIALFKHVGLELPKDFKKNPDPEEGTDSRVEVEQAQVQEGKQEEQKRVRAKGKRKK